MTISTKACKFGSHTFGVSEQLSQQARTVRFVKFKVETFYGAAGGLRHMAFHGTPQKQGCMCNGKTVRRNDKILDGECNSVRRDERRVGWWRILVLC